MASKVNKETRRLYENEYEKEKNERKYICDFLNSYAHSMVWVWAYTQRGRIHAHTSKWVSAAIGRFDYIVQPTTLTHWHRWKGMDCIAIAQRIVESNQHSTMRRCIPIPQLIHEKKRLYKRINMADREKSFLFFLFRCVFCTVLGKFYLMPWCHAIGFGSQATAYTRIFSSS